MSRVCKPGKQEVYCYPPEGDTAPPEPWKVVLRVPKKLKKAPNTRIDVDTKRGLCYNIVR